MIIGLAEIGDKSQLVCMTLAARQRPWPVLLGAAAAFAILNVLAVVFGASVAAWLPEQGLEREQGQPSWVPLFSVQPFWVQPF